MKQALVTALTALGALLPLCSQAADLMLEVDGLDTSRLEGATLMVAVFTEPAGWLRQPRAGHRFVLGPEANGRMDMNPMGIPTEPYGFSNNAAGSFGPPKFEQAVMTPVVGATVKVRLN
jgi:uncharacterized protein (DUF2141 family)